MSELADSQALEAAGLYAQDKTFSEIATTLEVSKSHAQVLTRRGIALSLSEMEKSDPDKVVEENPGEVIPDTPRPTNTLEDIFPSRSAAFPGQLPQDPRYGGYLLETEGIGRRILLTPKAIMIFDLWRGSGFMGDLSDFLEDAVNFMYESRRPRERLEIR